ncbi:IS3 family transposase [Cardinium endosymbiont of Philonthus spinipes]|uniref:IS3 family transposase n=1 Tax=Cardinium endosymbiont of Philonthus spinipes TaxID=3077941 RepID=UPI00313D2CD8
MGRKKISHFSSEEKTKTVLALLKENSTLSELSSKYGVTSKTIQNWKHQFLENASVVFDPSKFVGVYKHEIETLKHQNHELAKALGKTTVERDWAVGKLKSLDLLSKKSLVGSKLVNLPKARQCALLSINRSLIYYKSRKTNNCNTDILNKIDSVYREHPEYGYRYIYNQLQEEGFDIGRDRVLKYMGMLGISAIYPRKKPSISCKDNQHKVYSYLLDKYWSNSGKTKHVHVPTSNQVWSGDITYIRTASGFMYLSAIIDWHSKAILSYKVSNTMDTTLVTDTLQAALIS